MRIISETKQKRNYKLDNIKALLIFLVVLGHFIEPFIEDKQSLKILYTLIYSFHMPLFVLVSGMLLKLNNNKFKKSSIIIPTILFQLFFSISQFLINKSFFSPYWILWFMLTLFIWNYMTPYIVKIKYHFIISLLSAIFCISFSFTRVIVFYLFFLIGYHLDDINLEKIRKYKKYFYLTSIIGFVITIFIFVDINPKIFYYSLGYKDLGLAYFQGLLIRIISLCISFIFSMSIYLLMTNKKQKFTYIGKNTLSIYLFHGIIIKTLPLIYLVKNYSYYILIILSIIVTLILSIKHITNMIKKTTNFIIK